MPGRLVPLLPATDLKAGALACVAVEGTPIAVANIDGRFYAFEDTCTHEQCSLAEGSLDGTTVMCPCHGAEFDVTTGAVVGPPAFEAVRSYPVQVQDGQLMVEI